MVSWLWVRYQDIKISTSNQRIFQVGIFFHKIKNELFMRFNTVYMAYITYLIVQIFFQNFMSLKRILFQRQRKVFFKKNTKILLCFLTYALTLTDNRQKSNIRSNIGMHDFVKIRRTFINVLYLFFNLRYIHAWTQNQSILVTLVTLDSCHRLFLLHQKDLMSITVPGEFF